MKFNREIVTLQCGQAGIQIGDAIWQTLAAEHNISSMGMLPESYESSCIDECGIKTFFHNGPDGRYIPRAVIIDSEPTVVDEIRSGYFRKLFHPDLLISGEEDAANNYARGYYSIGKSMLTHIMEKCRYIAEACENLQGFMNFSGCGGGTGSGLFTKLLEQLSIEYSGKAFLGTLIVPGSSLSNCVVDPYNTTLRVSKIVETDDLNFILNNQSLYSICQKLNIERPTYHNINKVLTPILTTLSAPLRFSGPLSGTFSEISTNLVPYPRISLSMLNYTPFHRDYIIGKHCMTCKEMTIDLFDSSNNLLGQNLVHGSFMSAVLIYRGCHIVNGILDAVRSLKAQKNYKWVDWCPTGFKISQSTFPALHTFSKSNNQPDRSIMMLSNHSSINRYLDQETGRFFVLFKKRSYMFWYLSEGMEEIELTEAMEDVMTIKWDYYHISTDQDENDVQDTNETYDYDIDPSIDKNYKNNFSKSENLIVEKSLLTEENVLSHNPDSAYYENEYNDDLSRYKDDESNYESIYANTEKSTYKPHIEMRQSSETKDLIYEKQQLENMVDNFNILKKTNVDSTETKKSEVEKDENKVEGIERKETVDEDIKGEDGQDEEEEENVETVRIFNQNNLYY